MALVSKSIAIEIYQTKRQSYSKIYLCYQNQIAMKKITLFTLAMLTWLAAYPQRIDWIDLILV